MAAHTAAGVVEGFSTPHKDPKKLYDDWGSNYDKDVRDWGYDMPEVVARTLKKHAPAGTEESLRVLDAGAGNGLSGQALAGEGFKDVTGMDLSPGSVKLAREKGIYKVAEVGDLSKPLKYRADQFDAVVVVGVLTYIQPESGCMEEFCRIVKAGGLIVFTHRTDYVDKWAAKHEELESQGKWEKVEVTEPLAYLPSNPDFADKIKVVVHVYRVRRKTDVEMKVTSKRSAVFYTSAAKGILQGSEDKEGNKREPVDSLTISGLGDAIGTAVAAAAACEREGLAAISKVVTGYPSMKSMECPSISIVLSKK